MQRPARQSLQRNQQPDKAWGAVNRLTAPPRQMDIQWDNGGVKHIPLNIALNRIHSVLPQTQCTRCGYIDCAAYAKAIASEEAPINQCPPGGVEGIRRLSDITGLPVQRLNPVNGLEAPRVVALIDEEWCIGCTLCIKACPVDAIIGTNKTMHTVLESTCTGCELCLPACPVDCISLENVTGVLTGWDAWSAEQAQTALSRYEFHRHRKNQDQHEGAEMLEKTAETPMIENSMLSAQAQTDFEEAERKRAVIKAALDRSRAQRASKT